MLKKSVSNLIFKIKCADASKTWLFLGGLFCWFLGFLGERMFGVFLKKDWSAIKLNKDIFENTFFTLGLHHHFSLKVITLTLLLTLTELHVCLCFIPALRKRKKFQILQEVFPYQRQSNFWESNIVTNENAFWRVLFRVSFLSFQIQFFSLSSRHAVPMGSTIESVSVVEG